MNLGFLVSTGLFLGKLNATALGRLGTWLDRNLIKLTTRAQLSSEDQLTISCWCAAFMTIGFTVLGVAQTYGVMSVGQYPRWLLPLDLSAALK